MRRSLAMVSLYSLAVAAGARSSTAHAQATAESAPASGDIVVTAQRRAERLQDVPISVTALSSDKIRTMNPMVPQDLFKQVPGISTQVPTGANSFIVYNMRGVSHTDTGYLGEMSIASYRDDVYLGNPALTQAPIFDLERVEVLRGPQGTLYGRNASGGLVSIISASPTAELSGRAMLQYGRFGDWVAEGMLSGPLSDSIRARFAARYHANDGMQRNALDGRKWQKVDHQIDMRGIIDADLSPTATLRLLAHYSDAKGITELRPVKGRRNPASPTTLCADPNQIIANQCVVQSGYRTPGFDPTIGYSSRLPQPYTFKNYGGQIRLSVDLGDVNLTSISAYENVRSLTKLDSLGIPAQFGLPVLGLQSFGTNGDQFSQEIRLSARTGRLSWQAGAFYFTDSRIYFNDNLQSLQNIVVRSDQSISSIAAFAQGTYAVTDTVNFTAGIRYTKDKKRIRTVAASNPIYGTGFGSPILPAFPYSNRISPDRVTWRLGVDWHASPDFMVFATASTGYKMGGYNTTAIANTGAIGPVDSEFTTSFEAGFKSQLLDRRLTFNLTGYYLIWDQVQAAATFTNAQGGSNVQFGNIGKADTYGIEAELAARPATDLTITAGLSLNHNRLKARPGILIGGLPANGKKLANTPSTQITGAVNWEPQLSGDAGRLLFNADVGYQSKSLFRPDNLAEAAQPGYAIVNASIGWASKSDTLRLEGFVKNLTDNHYFTNASVIVDEAIYFWGAPRTYGVRLTAKF